MIMVWIGTTGALPYSRKNTLDLILTSLPGQFQDLHSPDKLSDHDIVVGTLKVAIPPIKKPRRKVYSYQKGDYVSMRKYAFEFAKETYFNGYADTRSVQENFNLFTSFFKIRQINTSLPKLVGRSLRFPGILRKQEGIFAEETKLMLLKQKGRAVRNSYQNLKL